MARHYSFFKSIRAKASLLFFSVFLIIILPVNYVIYTQLKLILEEADTKELKIEAEKILNKVHVDPPIVPLPPVGYLLKLQFQRDVVVQDIFTSPGFPQLPEGSFLFDSFSYDTLSVVNLQNAGDHPGLVVTLVRSNDHLQTQLNNLKSYLFMASAGSILIAGFLVFMAAGIVLRPIKKIIMVARHINASNSIERVPVPKMEDESHQLAETLNAMLSRIEASIKNQVNFFASAAHELKTPLAVMQTELTLMRDNNKDEQINKLLQSQLTEVQRLDRVIQDFLLISQLKSDTLTLRTKDERIDEVVYAAIKKVKYLSQDRSTQILVTIDDSIEDRLIPFDFDKMETVFTNLIENSIRYSPENSIIRILIKSDGNAFSVACINPIKTKIENIDSLTSEFKKSYELSSGLGMGLWICNQIVKLHKGKLTLTQQGDSFNASVLFR